MMEKKSATQIRADLCNSIRNGSDEEILRRLRGICENELARDWTLRALNLKPGDPWYQINTDTEFEITE